MSDISDLENDLAKDRQNLARSLDDLSAAVRPDNVKSHATALAESCGGDLGRQAWDAARQNPAAFALVGAGLGLLLTGAGTRQDKDAHEPATTPRDMAAQGFDARLAAADAEIKQSATGKAAPVSTPRAAWLRAKLHDGLDALPKAAQTRVIAARKAALDAQEKVEDQARKAAAASETALNDQPLAIGAVALGLGALIGAVLPSTRREDDILGERRDAFMSAARGALSKEIDQLRKSNR